MKLIYPGAEGRHSPRNHTMKWSESYFYEFYEPVSTVGGVFRIGILENSQTSNMWFFLFKNKKLVYNRFCSAAPYTSKRLEEGVEVGNLQMTSIEHLQKSLVEFSLDQFSLSLTFDDRAPMIDTIEMVNGKKDKEPSYRHLEAPVRATGSFTLRGETTQIEQGYGVRDISWGVRNWAKMIHYRLSWPVFTDGEAVVITHALYESGRGYQMAYYDGSQWLQIKEVEDTIEFADDDMTVTSLHYRLWDSNDKLIEYTAKPIFNYMIPVDGFRTSMNLMEYKRSDGTVGYGTSECGFLLPWDKSFYIPRARDVRNDKHTRGGSS
jgi:hypothetical protein